MTTNNENQIVDHLFRHQFGKMVAILTRIFGLSHLQTIEDAVQDTFVIALKKWRNQIPENPEAWLTQAAKNRTIDLLRKLKADNNRSQFFESGSAAILINDMFLEHEIEDSQLRMIFTACHPSLKPIEQIAFALKSISGFSIKEISSALLVKEATIKKRLLRSRQALKSNNISFQLPDNESITDRVQSVLNVIYLIFNEGFHSGKKEMLIRKDLCGEAIRLCKLLLKKEPYRSGTTYSLFALMCLHASRIESKSNEHNDVISLENQDRTKWHQPLIQLAIQSIIKSEDYDDVSSYAIEAAIALEHVKAKSFETTNWQSILKLYKNLYSIYSSPNVLLNIAIVHLQLNENDRAFETLEKIKPGDLEQRAYLYFGTKAKYYASVGENENAIKCYKEAINNVTNEAEKAYLSQQKELLQN